MYVYFVLYIGLQKVFNSCPNLLQVHLRRCSEVDDDCVMTLAQNCGRLEVLNLHGCEKVGGVGLIGLATNSKYLECLDLTRTQVSQHTYVYAFAIACKCAV